VVTGRNHLGWDFTSRRGFFVRGAEEGFEASRHKIPAGG